MFSARSAIRCDRCACRTYDARLSHLIAATGPCATSRPSHVARCCLARCRARDCLSHQISCDRCLSHQVSCDRCLSHQCNHTETLSQIEKITLTTLSDTDWCWIRMDYAVFDRSSLLPFAVGVCRRR